MSLLLCAVTMYLMLSKMMVFMMVFCLLILMSLAVKYLFLKFLGPGETILDPVHEDLADILGGGGLNLWGKVLAQMSYRSPLIIGVDLGGLQMFQDC